MITIEKLEIDKEEYRKKRDRNILIDREVLFRGLTLILNCFEGSMFEFEKYYGAVVRMLNYSNSQVGYSTTTYVIKRQGDVILEDKRIGNYQDDDVVVQSADKKITLNFAEVTDLMTPIYDYYPYLKGIVDKMRISLLLDGTIDELDMLKLAREYVMTGERMIDVTEYLKSMKSRDGSKILNILDSRIDAQTQANRGLK